MSFTSDKRVKSTSLSISVQNVLYEHVLTFPSVSFVNIFIADFGSEIDLEEDEDLHWLSSNFRPWPDIVSAWERTNITRMCIITGLKYKKAEDNPDSIEDKLESVPKYFSYFKALTTPNGWELVRNLFIYVLNYSFFLLLLFLILNCHLFYS